MSVDPFHWLAVPPAVTRIFSDIHFADRASRVHRFEQLRPLLDGIGALVLNGDTVETRPGPDPLATAQQRAAALAFFRAGTPAATFVTGNHDPDLSSDHVLELAGGQVFLTHGDILHDSIVPWGQDAPIIRPRLAAGVAALPPADRERLEPRLAVWRRVAATIPQRHQAERHGFKYLRGFLRDTLWPPARVFRILNTWRLEPGRAAAFAARHRPQARFFLLGHTHRPGVWRTPAGVTVINTGSFVPPLGGCVVDLAPGRLTVRRIAARGGDFHVGRTVAEFPLAPA